MKELWESALPRLRRGTTVLVVIAVLLIPGSTISGAFFWKRPSCCGRCVVVRNVCPPHIETVESPLAAKYLSELQSTDIDTRIAAVEQLGQLKAKSAVPRLISMLPGDWDEQTMTVVDALGNIGDARALPTLRAMQNERRFFVPGQISVALASAIESCER